ncbi:MAG: hypothetical protein KAR42_09220 [candidate division Zixibacteria bacterium]|nr:hypothetical protein [candidate division Zixibacteria bacterium]
MSIQTLQLSKREDIAPICPHCSNELNHMYYRTKGLGLFVGKNVIYFCPHCHKILGIGQSRMA